MLSLTAKPVPGIPMVVRETYLATSSQYQKPLTWTQGQSAVSTLFAKFYSPISLTHLGSSVKKSDTLRSTYGQGILFLDHLMHSRALTYPPPALIENIGCILLRTTRLCIVTSVPEEQLLETKIFMCTVRQWTTQPVSSSPSSQMLTRILFCGMETQSLMT